MDRAEGTGFGVAVAGHVVLFGLLALTVKPPETPPPPPSVEVEFVDGAEVALEAQAAPAPSVAPEIAPEVVEPALPEPEPIVAPVPEPIPAPTPTPIPQPTPKAQPRPQPKAPPRPQPKTQPRPQPKAQPKAAARPAPSRPNAQPKAATGSRLGADFLKGIGTDAAPKAAAASGPVLSAAALAGIQQVIANRIQPCANRQISPGPGANRIRTSLRLRLRENGALAAAPAVVSQAGVTEENERWKERVADLAVAAVKQCAPLRGLPAELYKTPKGGWSDIRFSYKLPG